MHAIATFAGHHSADSTLQYIHRGHAAAIILRHWADTGRSYWASMNWDWAILCGSSATEFLEAMTPPTERAVRPFLVALLELLCGFTGFHHLGNFNRLHLACLVFGEEQLQASIAQAAGILDPVGLPEQHLALVVLNI
jgi:hypothetical protein